MEGGPATTRGRIPTGATTPRAPDDRTTVRSEPAADPTFPRRPRVDAPRPTLAAVRRSALATLALVGLAVGGLAPTPAAGTPTVASTPVLASTAGTPLLASTSGTPLSWAPPVLTDPLVIDVSATRRDLVLDPARDYVLRMPGTPLTVLGGLRVTGGNDVVLVGGEISVPAGATATNSDNRGLYLKNQTGTVHVEGLAITGPGLGEGINLDQRAGGVVQLQNLRIDTVHGSAKGHHADLIQTWAGPRQLLVDGLTGSTQYQGFFLLPLQMGSQRPEVVDLRRVDVTGTSTSGHLIWRDTQSWPLTLTDVWLAPRYPDNPATFLYPSGTGAGTEAWPSVRVGAPPGGPFVPVGTAGTGYVSPGYRDATGGSTAPPTPLVAPVVGAVAGARLAGGSHYTAASSVELTWSGSGPAATSYQVLRDGVVVGTVSAPTTRAVVPLPTGPSSVTVRARADGQPDATSGAVTVVRDGVAPVISTGPAVALRTGTLSSSGAAPLVLSWAATDDARLRDVSLTSPVAATYLPTQDKGYVNVAAGTRSWTLVARDEAGNTATRVRDVAVAVVPEGSAQRTGTWTTVADSRHHGGTALRATAAGVSMSHTFTGTSVAWVAHRSSTSGRAVVYVDGAKVTTLDLGATSASYSQVVWNRSWPTSGTHTVRVVVEGTAGRPGVTSDGFVSVG